MFGTGGDGEEQNGNGLSAVCSGLFCLLPLQLKEWGIYICFLIIWWTIPKKTNRKFLFEYHSLHKDYKIRIIRKCTKRLWANVLLIREKKNEPF